MGYKGLQGGYNWLEGFTRGYKSYRLQRVTEGYKGLERVTRVTRGYMGLQRGLQGVTEGYRGYKGLQRVTSGYTV